MPDTTPAENPAGPATALAEPPAPPPTTPPGAIAAGTPKPRGSRTGVIAAIVLSILAFVLLVVVVVIVTRSRGGSTGGTVNLTAYESAMQKAGGTAPYPGKPVDLTSVKASGSHPFTATFTADEIAALLNTFPYEYDSAGMKLSLRNVALTVPAAGTARLAASVTLNGGTYVGRLLQLVSLQRARTHDRVGQHRIRRRGRERHGTRHARVPVGSGIGAPAAATRRACRAATPCSRQG